MLNKIIFPLTLLLTPLLFLTLTPNFFGTPKQIILVLAVLLLIFGWVYRLVTTSTLETSSSPLRFGLAAFALAIILNLILHKEGRTESLIGPSCIYLALSAWTYFLTLHKNAHLVENILLSILGSTAILALHTILQLTLIYRLTFLPLYLQSRAFTLTGNLLTTVLLIGLGTTISFARLRSKTYYLVFTILHLIAFVALSFLLLPGHELALNILPLTASWNIALDGLKSVQTFFFGVGLSGFATFYKSVKPLFLNATPFWNILPTSASSEFLSLLTTTGMVGFLAFLSLPLLTLKSLTLSTTYDLQPKLLFYLSGLALIFSPGSIPLLLIFFTSLGLLNAQPPHTHSLARPLTFILAGVSLALVGLISYYGARVVLAEVDMRQAQIALANNDGRRVYDKNIAALGLLPSLTSYHLSASQVNFSIAAALSQKDSLTDTERQNVSQLVSQSIREAKLAANLSPNDSSTWQNLGNIYRNLVNVAAGADQFAIQSYSQAVALDPANPLLRLEFGGFLYQLGGSTQKASDMTALYARAQNEFQTTIQLKPDYPNSYYNLAKLFETTKDYQNAYLAMQKTLSLLGPNSPDLSQATTELENIKAKLPKPTSTPQPQNQAGAAEQLNSLAQPSPLPSPIDGGLLELPTDTPMP